MSFFPTSQKKKVSTEMTREIEKECTGQSLLYSWVQRIDRTV